MLVGSVSVDEALVTLPGHRLRVLTAGAAHAQPAELLGSAAMHRLVDLLRRQFDRILIDTSGAETADAGALSQWVDGTLLVVRAGRTPRPAIERSLAVIAPQHLMGLVLNDSRGADGIAGA
ncbi:MAG: hypothetical protein R2712_18030 [Vicinamibacterales bacterium]